MSTILKFLLIAVVSYIIGNFQTGVVVGHIMGKIDVRSVGSKSTGTTNVLRTMGWLPSILTLAGDTLKGFLAAWLGMTLLGVWGMRLGGLCAVIGHNWPVFYKFKGGKGIATSLGVIFMINGFIAVGLIVLQIIVLVITRTMSVASIISATTFFVVTLIVSFGDWWTVGYALLLASMIYYTHRENLDRLRKHKENTLDFAEIDRISREKNAKTQK